MTSRLAALLLSSTLLIGTQAYAQVPDVVVSIKPLHSIVANVMDGVGEPKLIVDGAASPHSFNLRPSNAKDLQNADVVFWLGNGFETFLEKPLETLSAGAVAIKLGDAPNITRLNTREGGAFEAHDHSHDEAEDEHAHEGEGHQDDKHEAHDHADEDNHAHADDGEHGHDHDHAHGETDLHIWLDPQNAVAITKHVANILSVHDEANAEVYQKNAKAYVAELEKADADIKAELADIKDKPFIVFHDAYQYFEQAYGLNAAGSITVNPETPPGAERISELQKKVKDANVGCIFAEPQFEPKVIKIIAEGTEVKTETLDPEATALTAGKPLYLDLIKQISTAFKTCLSG